MSEQATARITPSRLSTGQTGLHTKPGKTSTLLDNVPSTVDSVVIEHPKTAAYIPEVIIEFFGISWSKKQYNFSRTVPFQIGNLLGLTLVIE